MEMLSSASQYAINAVLYLATESSVDKKIGVKVIANAIKVPTPFLAKLLQNLAKKNAISSTKGPNGGFYLTDKNKKQKLLSIVEHIDGLSKFTDCVLGLSECSNEKPCPIHFSIQPFKEKMYDELNNTSITDFAAQVQQGRTFLNL